MNKFKTTKRQYDALFKYLQKIFREDILQLIDSSFSSDIGENGNWFYSPQGPGNHKACKSASPDEMCPNCNCWKHTRAMCS